MFRDRYDNRLFLYILGIPTINLVPTVRENSAVPEGGSIYLVITPSWKAGTRRCARERLNKEFRVMVINVERKKTELYR